MRPGSTQSPPNLIGLLFCFGKASTFQKVQIESERGRRRTGERAMASASDSIDEYVDEAYLQLLTENLEDPETSPAAATVSSDTFQVSDDRYARGMQLQEVLVSSAVASQTIGNGSSSDGSLTIRANQAAGPSPSSVQTVFLPGQSSRIFCEICDDPKEPEEMFAIETCSHSFCSDCIGRHVAAKVWENVAAVSCPGLRCESLIEFESCAVNLPKAVADRWSEVKCEALFVAAAKLYCPFKDCSAVLLIEEGEEGGAIRECECPECHRLFCARCNVPWHAGVACEELEGMEVEERGREDLMVRDLAKSNKWGRCPQCKFYVERTEGCPHMTCRCKYQFCYGCGSQWSDTHAGCQGN